MPKTLRRWLPLIGTATLAASITARAWGAEHLAGPLEALSRTLGLWDLSAVSADELVAAAAAVTGVALKIRSQVNKTLEGRDQ